MATATKATRTRKAKTAEDLKADLAKARAALAALEQRAYAGELDGLDFPQFRRHFSMSDLLLFKLNGA